MRQATKQHLSPKELGKAVGVSESTLKRWADEGEIRVYRTAGGHRRIDLSEAVRFIRKTGMPVREPRLLGLSALDGPFDPVNYPADAAKLMRAALEEGDTSRFRAMLVSTYLAGRSVAEVCDGPIAEAMHAIGEFWQHRNDGILIEHRATDTCIAALNQLRSLLVRPDPGAPRAIGGAFSNDPYLVPSLMAATVLSSEGWDATNLGPETPVDVLVGAVEQLDVRLVWLSVSVERKSVHLHEDLNDLADRLQHRSDVSIAVGGRVLPQPLKIRRPNLQEVRSMTELVAFTRGLRAKA